MSNNTILNPDTPLAFLPPDVAYEHVVSEYLHVATLSAFIWDILLYCEQDFQLLFRQRLSFTSATYFISRISTLVYVTLGTIILTSSVGNCNTLEAYVGWSLIASSSSTSMLFLIRVRAIFVEQPLVVGFFCLLWLVDLGTSMVVPFSVSAGHIGPTLHCTNHYVKPVTAATLVSTAVNDTLVLIAVSYVLITSMRTSQRSGVVEGFKAFFFAKDMPQMSKALLQGGQQYYFLTVGMNIFTAVLKLTPSVPPIYRAMFASPNFALENSMACRVYRNMKFGLVLDPTLPSINLTTSHLPGRRPRRSLSFRLPRRPGNVMGRPSDLTVSLSHKNAAYFNQRSPESPRFDIDLCRGSISSSGPSTLYAAKNHLGWGGGESPTEGIDTARRSSEFKSPLPFIQSPKSISDLESCVS